MPSIISASRRTDIPRYFAEFFARRRKVGHVEFRNVFGGRGRASLRNEDVLGYLFWTRFARPFRDNLCALRDDGIPYVFQYTITGYGRDLEPHTPSAARASEDFLALAAQLPGPACIAWRYDPIVLSDTYDAAWHVRNFSDLAGKLAGATTVVNASLVEPYKKAIRRLGDETVIYRELDPSRHRAAARRYPHLRHAGAREYQLIEELRVIASEHGMELRACANPELDLPPSQCCGVDLFAAYGQDLVERLESLAARPTRQSCRCLQTVDIGMDNTCVAGCKYCYVVTTHETAVENFKRHDENAASVR
jgi:hypothetical protein